MHILLPKTKGKITWICKQLSVATCTYVGWVKGKWGITRVKINPGTTFFILSPILKFSLCMFLQLKILRFFFWWGFDLSCYRFLFYTVHLKKNIYWTVLLVNQLNIKYPPPYSCKSKYSPGTILLQLFYAKFMVWIL